MQIPEYLFVQASKDHSQIFYALQRHQIFIEHLWTLVELDFGFRDLSLWTLRAKTSFWEVFGFRIISLTSKPSLVHLFLFCNSNRLIDSSWESRFLQSVVQAAFHLLLIQVVVQSWILHSKEILSAMLIVLLSKLIQQILILIFCIQPG